MKSIKLEVETFRTVGELREALKNVPDDCSLYAFYTTKEGHVIKDIIPYQIVSIDDERQWGHDTCILNLTKSYADYDKNK